MKTSILSLILLCGFAIVSFGQESLIADIMNVAPVTIKADETTKEANDDYQKEFDEQKVKVENLMTKHSEKFAGDVKELIERFNKVLAKGIEQDVKNEKQRVATQVNALSMALIRSKKEVLVQFNNVMTTNIRELPKSLKDDKESELGEITKTYQENIDAEFKANQEVLKGFKATEFLMQSME